METLMRTTFTIDDELLAEYKRLAAASHRSLSDVVQDALREALARRREREGRPPVELPVFRGAGGVLPGVDLSSNAALSELLDADGP
jgi:hypothetical protein